MTPDCSLCMDSRLVRVNIHSGVSIPWLPERLRDVDPKDEYHRTKPCPECVKSARSTREKLGWKPLSEEEKIANLNHNLRELGRG